MSKIRYEQQQDAVKTIIERGCRCKEDASRHGLLDTPKRVAQAWRSMAAGDGSIEHASDIIKNALFFEPILTTSPHCGFVLVKDMTFSGLHKHSLLPMYGKCHVAYIPKEGTIVGLSKLSRVISSLSVRGLQLGPEFCDKVLQVVDRTVSNNGGIVVVLDVFEYHRHHEQRYIYSRASGAFSDQGETVYHAEEVFALLGIDINSVCDVEHSTENPLVKDPNSHDSEYIEAVSDAVGVLLESVGEDPDTAEARSSAQTYASWFVQSTRGYSMEQKSFERFSGDNYHNNNTSSTSGLSAATDVVVAVGDDDMPCDDDAHELHGDQEVTETYHIPCTSQCEHHLLPFTGDVVVLCRRKHDPKKTWQKSTFQHMCEYQVEMFSKRLQVQERLTQQIADGIWGCLGDDHMVKEIMVVCQCKHMCMIARGVQQHCTSTATYTVRGDGPWSQDGMQRSQALAHVLQVHCRNNTNCHDK
eukprot:jgi/Picre1/31584/NNA_006936.t1